VAVSDDVVGPIPPGADPDEYDRMRRRVLWAMPSGLYLVGSAAGDEVNLMTANWATQVSSDPKLLAVSVEVGALTHRLIADGGAFSLCILKRDDRAVVRRFAKPAVWDPDASTLHGEPVWLGRQRLPVLASAAAWLDCDVRHRLDFGSHSLFVGEVVQCGAADEFDEILRMEDTRMSYGG
jgi:flavin reductase (DIM6/NTAB) family NADH-FMN oxidoreductase RutF